MRIAIVNNLFPPMVVGGAEMSVALTAEALAAGGDEVHVVTTYCGAQTSAASGPGQVAIHEVATRLPYDAFSGGSPGRVQRASWHAVESFISPSRSAFEGVFGDLRPDVVWSNGLASFGMGPWDAALLNKSPVIHTIRDYYLLCARSTMFRESNCRRICIECRTLRIRVPKRAGRLSAIVGVSEHVLNTHLRIGMFDGVPSSVISNPVTATESAAAAKPTSAATVFGFLGRLEPEKGVADLVEAFIATPSRESQLLIGGRGSSKYADYLREISKNDARIRWLGFVNPERFLSEIDVLVAPAKWHEPFGRTVVEAGSMGIPSIVSCAGGLPELVAGGAGWVVPPGDTRALSTILERLQREGGEIAAAGTLASKRAALCTPARIAAAYRELFHEHV